MKISQIAQELGLNDEQHNETPVFGFVLDSRKVKPGDLFLAFHGERVDGHDYLEEVAQKGAVAALIQTKKPGLPIPQLQVPDVLAALTQLARAHRQTITCPIIALTGSNGKTSVKEMISAILPQPSLATLGNLNNHIGVPLSILRLQPEHQYAVFELGANHPGEIAHTAALVQPQITLINNIAPAHVEGFGSIDGVARAKGEIYAALPVGGTAVVNADDAFARFWDDLLADKKVLRYSLHQKADVNASQIQFNSDNCAQFRLILPAGEMTVSLQVPGKHAVANALAAATCCFAAGVPLEEIVAGLERFQGVSGRLSYKSGKNKSVIIDDTYNANLKSVLTAIDVLAHRKGKRILILGDLGELGTFTMPHHEEIGRTARSQGIDQLLTCGKHSEASSNAFGDAARHYLNQSDLIQAVLPLLTEDTTVLVKGSRSAAMEKIVAELVDGFSL